MSVVRVSPVDAAWLLLESRDTPMHVGGLMEFTRPPDAGPDYLKVQVDRMRAARALPQPWNLKLVGAPLIGERLPLMQTVREVDLDLHVRHSALPHPGGQRELGVLVSRLHGHPLDLHRPLWEVHVIEGLEDDRFAIYLKIHHSLIDGVSGMRMMLRALSSDPEDRETKTPSGRSGPAMMRAKGPATMRARWGVCSTRHATAPSRSEGSAEARSTSPARPSGTAPCGRPSLRRHLPSAAGSRGSAGSLPSSTSSARSRLWRRRRIAR